MSRDGPRDPRRRHTRRLDQWRDRRSRLETREGRLALSRLLIAGIGVVIAWAVLDPERLAFGWILLPALAFGMVVVWHDRVIRRRIDAERAVAHHESCLRRMDDAWQGEGPEGTRHADPGHPYASDLDLFGHGSLFQRLCTARTRPGEETLARWLTHPGRPDDLLPRQEAVRELTPRIKLRERLALVGDDIATMDPLDLAGWARAGARFGKPSHVARLRWAAAGLVAVQLATLLGWLSLGWPRPVFLLALGAQGLLGLRLRDAVRRTIHGVEGAGRQLELLTGILDEVETGTFESRRLATLQASLQSGDDDDGTGQSSAGGRGSSPSTRVATLRRLVVLLDSRDNLLFAPLALLVLWSTQLALAVEAWRLDDGRQVDAWLDAVGEFEALTALAAYRFERPEDVFPRIVADGTLFAARDLGHPLLPRDRCVHNDVELGGETRLLVVSGSNMSGKSTLLRTVGVNAVLALAGATVRAGELRLSRVVPGASIQVVDSLQEGVSGFYAEIRRLRALVDLASANDPPLLFLLDEIMARTNSHDRLIGAEAVLRSLLRRGAFGLVTTHDLALTRLADDLGDVAANVHFVDHLEDGEIRFDYRLRPGVVQRSNAVELMRSIGLDV